MSIEQILSNTSAAQRAVPGLGYGWPDSELKALGEEVKRLYPELSAWGPHLAGEAHLFFASRCESAPIAMPNDPGTVRNDAFLAFLVERIAHTPGGGL